MSDGKQMGRIWILGAGRFGRRAADILLGRFPSASITVVDRNPKAPVSAEIRRRVQLIREEGIGFLKKHLNAPDGPDWIVPAIPLHVAFEWIKADSESSCGIREISVPEPVVVLLPNPIRGWNQAVYTSNADFVCPENCAEPETICTCTRKPRPRVLHDFLAVVEYRNFRSIVVVSRQLAPGVGGYSPEALFEARAKVLSSDAPILLSTACKCHGVMHAAWIQRI
jgi:hypothetical protein